jgi:hypothetical protein
MARTASRPIDLFLAFAYQLRGNISSLCDSKVIEMCFFIGKVKNPDPASDIPTQHESCLGVAIIALFCSLKMKSCCIPRQEYVLALKFPLVMK